jgi:hypothetical protein
MRFARRFVSLAGSHVASREQQDDRFSLFRTPA